MIPCFHQKSLPFLRCSWFCKIDGRGVWYVFVIFSTKLRIPVFACYKPVYYYCVTDLSLKWWGHNTTMLSKWIPYIVAYYLRRGDFEERNVRCKYNLFLLSAIKKRSTKMLSEEKIWRLKKGGEKGGSLRRTMTLF